jgi:hypothetical protein
MGEADQSPGARFRAWLAGFSNRAPREGLGFGLQPFGYFGPPHQFFDWAESGFDRFNRQVFSRAACDELAHHLTEAGCTDEVYRAGLGALECGELDFNELKAVRKLALLRLGAALPELAQIGPKHPIDKSGNGNRGWVYLMHEGAMSLVHYAFDVHVRPAMDAASPHIRTTALALAHALRGSGRADDFPMADGRPLAEFLMELAARRVEEQEPFRPTAMLPTGRSGLNRYVMRALRERVSLVWPERERSNWGFNEITARLATVVLAKPIIANDVANAIKNTPLHRRYER